MNESVMVAGKERREWIAALQNGLRKDAVGVTARIRDARSAIANAASGGWDPGSLLAAANSLSGSKCLAGAHKRESGEPEADALLRAGFATLYWTLELDQHDRLAQRWSDDVRDDFILGRVFLHGLAGCGGAAEIAEWVAPMALRLLKAQGGILLSAADPALAAFMVALLEMQVSKRWKLPDAATVQTMQSKGPLLVNAGSPDAFAEALVAYCDDRLAYASGFSGRNATKKNRANETTSILTPDDAAAFVLLPVELLSLRFVYEMTTGKSLSLEADHPLLAPHRLSLPRFAPLAVDDDVSMLEEVGRRQFGAQWNPLVAAAADAPVD